MSSQKKMAKAPAQNTFTVDEHLQVNGIDGSQSEDEYGQEGNAADEGLDVFAAIDAAVAEVSLP